MVKVCKTDMFPFPLTKKMCHAFLQTTAKHTLISAVRHCQVKAYGGDERLAEAMLATRDLGAVNPREEDWDKVIQWTCNQGMLAIDQIGPMFDWIAWQMAEHPTFSMKGRTGVSVLRAVEEWHGNLAKDRALNGEKFHPSGFSPWFHEREVELQGGASYFEKHCITEVLSSKELANEGRVLCHCVSTYAPYVRNGKTSIWSYKVDGSRALTIELDNRNRRVVQVRGGYNSKPTDSQLGWVRRWMATNNLIWASWLG